MNRLPFRSNNPILTPNKIRTLYWDKKYTMEEIADKLGISFWGLYNFMDKYNIARRTRSEAMYLSNRLKPKFRIRSNLSITEEKLKVAGIMLYWAEGTLRGKTVDFVNSNSQMIQIFLKFLREICGANEKRLRIYLYAYSHHNLKELKIYWHNITKIPLSQFTKPYIRNGNPKVSNRKLPYGLIHIRYNDKRLLELIKSWIEEYKNWAGTQVAKGGRLSESSVLLKGRTEK